MALLCNFNKYTEKWKKQLMPRNIQVFIWGRARNEVSQCGEEQTWEHIITERTGTDPQFEKKALIAATERQPEMDSQMNAFQAAM